MSGLRGAPIPPRQLYFAYGSNLWMEQMAARCPNSYYTGRALLPDYRWQINERGYANIVPASGFTVHGLVYELGAGDEARLDRSEGVSSGAYSKAYLPVILHMASASLQMPTQSLVEDGGPERVIATARQQMTHVRKHEPCLWPGVLVYVSYDFVLYGQPREEYIDRMNSGIRDAIAMGIPEEFFENMIHASIPKRPVVRHVNHQRSPRSRATQTTSSPKIRRSQSVSYQRASPELEDERDIRIYGYQRPRGRSRVDSRYYR
ncbi:hypothetical protein E0Z10_g8702 [Xylaria hypoxylon]|uniref:gamma-glutamylcyclotransferase n=1 Tax=Xylaria hypoxylon TaxID=37992 RepID=A0A4Z0YM73_9PEZI|nr:hypothetical protein E0Z10_g8702 [Xylaria hypoxylon]